MCIRLYFCFYRAFFFLFYVFFLFFFCFFFYLLSILVVAGSLFASFESWIWLCPSVFSQTTNLVYIRGEGRIYLRVLAFIHSYMTVLLYMFA